MTVSLTYDLSNRSQPHYAGLPKTVEFTGLWNFHHFVCSMVSFVKQDLTCMKLSAVQCDWRVLFVLWCTARPGTLPATELMSSLPWLVWQYDVNSILKGIRNFSDSGCVRSVKRSIFRGIFYHVHPWLWLMFSGVLTIHIDMSDTYYSATMWTTYNKTQFLFMPCLQSFRRWSWMVNGLKTFEGWVTRYFDSQCTYVGIIGLHLKLRCMCGV